MTVLLTPDEGGIRYDVYLSSQLEELSRSAAQKLLEGGQVLCGGSPVKKNGKTAVGVALQVELPEEAEELSFFCFFLRRSASRTANRKNPITPPAKSSATSRAELVLSRKD